MFNKLKTFKSNRIPNHVFGILLIFHGIIGSSAEGILYPRESESREVKSLDGIWNFRVAGADAKQQETGFRDKWFTRPLQETGDVQLMPVPSSFNDISQSKTVRDHVGWVWYQTTFWIPKRWKTDERKVFLRFGSANYFAVVWVNGNHVMNHTGGHLPFVGDITIVVNYGQENLLFVALNNTLTPLTIPQGVLHYPNDTSRYPKDFVSQSYNFDYFHFAGIHRPVYVYTTPLMYIDDISIHTSIVNTNQLVGVLNFSVDVKSAYHVNSVYSNSSVNCKIIVKDKQNNALAQVSTCVGVVDIPNVKLWWPYLSQPKHETPGYLYTLEVRVSNSVAFTEEDVYRLKFGVRTVEWNATSFMINSKPFYFRGFGRHEDYNIRGRGVDLVLLVKDHNLIQWTGANSYRTSHYPYAEEIVDLTDELGIVIIDESPAIGLTGFGETLMNSHIQVMKELVRRDKNRPSVVMWSIGNEPKTLEKLSTQYFETVIAETKLADVGRRPTTIVMSYGFFDNKAPAVDIISINKYFAWYSDTGRLEVIKHQIPTEIHSLFKLFQRPVLMTEYGAGTVAGMHMNPSFVWTEDYQVNYLVEHFKAFDYLRKTAPYFIGEMIWNFADFATPEETFRPWGCMKGIFTRDRQPKMAAHIVRQRYWSLANETCSCNLPDDLKTFTFFTGVN